jgi:hypothetical protein
MPLINLNKIAKKTSEIPLVEDYGIPNIVKQAVSQSTQVDIPSVGNQLEDSSSTLSNINTYNAEVLPGSKQNNTSDLNQPIQTEQVANESFNALTQQDSLNNQQVR